MKDYLQRLFKNNGVARGWLYVITALALALGDDLYEFGKWLVENRAMLIERPFAWVDPVTMMFLGGGKAILAIGSALMTLRAYLDQHLTKVKTDKQNETINTPSA